VKIEPGMTVFIPSTMRGCVAAATVVKVTEKNVITDSRRVKLHEVVGVSRMEIDRAKRSMLALTKAKWEHESACQKQIDDAYMDEVCKLIAEGVNP